MNDNLGALLETIEKKKNPKADTVIGMFFLALIVLLLFGLAIVFQFPAQILNDKNAEPAPLIWSLGIAFIGILPILGMKKVYTSTLWNDKHGRIELYENGLKLSMSGKETVVPFASIEKIVFRKKQSTVDSGVVKVQKKYYDIELYDYAGRELMSVTMTEFPGFEENVNQNPALAPLISVSN